MRELAKRPIVGVTDNQTLGAAPAGYVINEGANTTQVATADIKLRPPVEEPAGRALIDEAAIEWRAVDGPLYSNDRIAAVAARANKSHPAHGAAILFMQAQMEVMRDDYERRIEQLRERWKGVVARERGKRQAQPTTNTRDPREIEERIARLAILWHTARDEGIGLRYLDAARALIWVLSPDVPWGESEEAAVATLKAVLEEEGLE